MAKKRRIIEHETQAHETPVQTASPSLFSSATGLWLATAILSSCLVYVAYWPSDSVEVQQGGARYVVAALLIAALLAALGRRPITRQDWLVDVAALALPSWMAISLWWQSADVDLRLGVNELGWWMSIAAVVIAGRRCFVDDRASQAVLILIVSIGVGLTIYGWHQLAIGFPEMIALYKADPESMLQQLGVDAPPDSSLRIVFENRLFDGGPTSTFALANSMAAVLVGALVLQIGITRLTWQHAKHWYRGLNLAAAVAIACMLARSGSRAAVAALCLIAVAVLTIAASRRRHEEGWQIIMQRRTFAVLAVAAALAMALVYRFRDSEFIQQAPASLAIRARYWIASAKMVIASPWLGIGPGQFKARYETYRHAASNEQIADPHHFLFQTLASGGLVAGAVLMGVLGMLAWIAWKRHSNEHGTSAPTLSIDSSKSTIGSTGVGAGVIAGLLVVWLLGLAFGLMPTLEPALLATFIAATFGVAQGWAWRSLQDKLARDRIVRLLAGVAAVAIAFDLLASGGMTVPGVGLGSWILACIAAPQWAHAKVRRDGGEALIDWREWFVPLVVFSALIVWHRTGISPVDQAQASMNRFEAEWARGQQYRALESLESAVEADPWDAQIALQLATVYRIFASEMPADQRGWEEKWDAAEANAAERAPLDPVMMRRLGDERLVHYQRFGDRPSLQAASRWYEKATTLSPAHETYAAQWAETLRELGDSRAKQVARRATELSYGGGYYERFLHFILIYPATKQSDAAVAGPKRLPAAKVLAPLLEERD